MFDEEQSYIEYPTINAKRSTFPVKFNHKTTANSGKLIPLFTDIEVYPGETLNLNFSTIIRAQTMLKPVMDNAFFDIYAFAVPYWLVWDGFRAFYGQNDEGAWALTTEKTIPTFKLKNKVVTTGSTLDYFGIPKGVSNLEFTQLPQRAYVKIWNDYFRDENATAPLTNWKDDTIRDAMLTDTQDNKYLTGAELLPVMKYHDYFTSVVPSPLKVSDPNNVPRLPVGTTAPIQFNKTSNVDKSTLTQVGIYNANGNLHTSSDGDPLGIANNGQLAFYSGQTSSAGAAYLSGYADLSEALGATLNAFREIVVANQILEFGAIYGTRYTSVVKSLYNVDNPDFAFRPEFLGGKRIPLNTFQVENTSASNEVAPQGNLTAFSHTADGDNLILKSFTNHSMVFVLGCIRYTHSYQQGLNRSWSKTRMLEFHNPLLNNLGLQGIKNKELMATGTSADDEIYAYCERWNEIRHQTNIISGEMNSSYAQAQDIWHYGDYYETTPVYSTDFLMENKDNIDRTLAVTSELANQFLIDFSITGTKTLELSQHSVPGLYRI